MSARSGRILGRMKGRLVGTLSSPVRCFVSALAVLCGFYVLLEILGYSPASSFWDLEYSQVGGLLSSILAADVVILASAGLISTIVFKYSVRDEEKGHKTIKFVGLTLIALLLSVCAITVEVFSFTVALSLIFLFAGAFELFAMLACSLGLVSS